MPALYRLARPLLFLLDPERAHALTLAALEAGLHPRPQVSDDARLALTQEALRTRTTAEWLARLDAADVPCAPVLTRSDMIRHPQIVENAIVIEYEHQRAGRLRQARPAARFSATPVERFAGAPVLGSDSAQVLAEAGYGDAEIAELAAAGVIGLASASPTNP